MVGTVCPGPPVWGIWHIIYLFVHFIMECISTLEYKCYDDRVLCLFCGRWDRAIREGLANKMMSEQRPDGSKEWAGRIWGQSIPGRGNCKCKGLGMGAVPSQKYLGDKESWDSGRGGEGEEMKPERPARVPAWDVLTTLHSCAARASPRPRKKCKNINSSPSLCPTLSPGPHDSSSWIHFLLNSSVSCWPGSIDQFSQKTAQLSLLLL